MAVLFMDSFDHYTAVLQKYDAEFEANGSGQNALVAGRFGNCMRIQGATVGAQDNYFAKFLPGSYGTLIVGMAMRWNGLQLPSVILALYETGTRHVDLRIDANRQLYVTRNGTTIGTTGTTVLTPTVWYYVELKVVIHDTAGSYELHVDGNLDSAASGLDTRNAGTTGLVNRVYFYGSTGSSASNWIDRDDVVIMDTSGPTNNDFLGDIRVQASFPTGNGASSQFVGQDADNVDNYALVDEPVPSTADYVESGVVGAKDTYVFGDLVPTTGAVYAVQVLPFAAKTDAGPASMVSVARVGGQEIDSEEKVLSTTARYLPDIRETKPGGGAWTIADVNNAEFGVKVIAEGALTPGAMSFLANGLMTFAGITTGPQTSALTVSGTAAWALLGSIKTPGALPLSAAATFTPAPAVTPALGNLAVTGQATATMNGMIRLSSGLVVGGTGTLAPIPSSVRYAGRLVMNAVGTAAFAGDVIVSIVQDGALAVSGTGTFLSDGRTTSTYRTTVLSDAPIAYYRLGETSGVLIEDEMNPSNEMDLLNTPTLGVTGLLTGDANKAITFSRASLEYCAGGASMPAGTSVGVSIEGWVRFASVTAATRYPIGRWFLSSPATEAQFYYDVANNAMRYQYQDATTARTINSDAWTPSTATTYHLVVTHDSVTEQVRFYVNGALHSLEDVSAFGVPVVHNANGFASIARSGSDYFDGTLDEIAFYNFRLSTLRVTAHYNAGITAADTSVYGALAVSGQATFAPKGSRRVPGALAVAGVATVNLSPVTDPTYAGLVLSDAPIAYYRMGEASGSVLDSVGSNHGTTSGPLTRNVTGLITAASGDDGAIDFAGSGYWTAPWPASLAQIWTIEMWLNVRSLAGSGDITFISSTNIYFNHSRPSGFMTANVGGLNAVTTNAGAISLGIHHVVWSRAGITPAQNKLYVDGVDVSVAVGANSTSPDTATVFRVGEYIDGTESFLGVIDELAIYNYALTAGDALAHYERGSSATPDFTYPGLVLSDNPLAYYRMGEASGSVLDSVGSAHGTVTQLVTRNVTGLVSDDDGAITFAGGHVSVPWPAALAQVWTIEAWLNVPSTGWATFICNASDSAPGSSDWTMRINSGLGQIEVLMYAPFARVVQTAADTVAMGRQHIVWTRAGTTVAQNKLYVDGIEVAGSGVAVAGTSADLYDRLWIGEFADGTEEFTGTVDEVAIYNYALTATEVLAHYNTGITVVAQDGALAVSGQGSFAADGVVGATYYMAPGGNDLNNGLTTATPWRSIQKFINTNPSPGSTLYVFGGNYALNQGGQTGEGFGNLIGTAANPITIAAYPGEVPVFSGMSGSTIMFWANGTSHTPGAQHVILDGFSFPLCSPSDEAVLVIGGQEPLYLTTNITIRNCFFGLAPGLINTDHPTGIVHGAEFITFEDCEFQGPGAGGGGGDACAIYSEPAAKNILFQRCIFHDWAWQPIQVWDYNEAAPTATIQILRCTFKDNSAAYDIDLRFHSTAVIQDCVFDGVVGTNAGPTIRDDFPGSTTKSFNYYSVPLTSTYGLPAGSPAINGAHDGTDAGAVPYAGTPPPVGKFIAPPTASPPGNDANPGTETAPWRTVQKFVNQATAGQTLYCRGGNYLAPPEVSTTGHSGTATQPITVKAYPGEVPVFTDSAWYIEGGSSYWVLDGLTINGNLVGSSAHVWVGNGRATPGPTDTHHITIRNCTIHKQGGAITAHCIYISHQCDNITIEYNTIVGVTPLQPAQDQAASGIHIFHDPMPTVVLIQRNIIRDCPKAIMVFSEISATVTTGSILHNTFQNNNYHIDLRHHGAFVVRDNVGDNSLIDDLFDPVTPGSTTADHNYWNQTITAAGKLTAGSPAINGALDGSDAGALDYP